MDQSLELRVEIPDDLPLISTDRVYLSKIIENFLSNAIKYTPKGSITIAAATKLDDMIISVKDTGIGIGRSDKNKLFQKFYRSEDYKIRQTNGTGLGLHIAQKLAGYIHGEVWFESKLGEGSTFFVKVPLQIKT